MSLFTSMLQNQMRHISPAPRNFRRSGRVVELRTRQWRNFERTARATKSRTVAVEGLKNSHPPYLGPVWFCSALVNSDTLTAYYGVKQSQFTKPTPEPPR